MRPATSSDIACLKLPSEISLDLGLSTSGLRRWRRHPVEADGFCRQNFSPEALREPVKTAFLKTDGCRALS